jgi:hypothetical protein
MPIQMAASPWTVFFKNHFLWQQYARPLLSSGVPHSNISSGCDPRQCLANGGTDLRSLAIIRVFQLPSLKFHFERKRKEKNEELCFAG